VGFVSSTSARLFGVITPALQQLAAGDVDELVAALLEEAIARWGATGWATFDHREANCTIQLYRWCMDARRNIPRLRILTIELEWVNPTVDMVEARASVDTATRPDVRIGIGQIAGRSLECKRLAPTGGRPRAYVYDGLHRFVSGKYGLTDDLGIMIGYLQAGTDADAVDAINLQIDGHPEMGPEGRLTAAPRRNAARYRSSHPRPHAQAIDVDHWLIDIQ
jgi:hypothetical protein